MRDFYNELGVPRNATPQEITRAYRQQAPLYHPDRNPNNPAAEERFKTIAGAYEVLSNDTERRRYDLAYQQQAMGAGPPATAAETHTRPQVPRHIKFNSRYDFARAAEAHDLSGHIISLKSRGDYNDGIILQNRHLSAIKFHNAELFYFRFQNCSFLNTDFSGVKNSDGFFDIDYLVDLSGSIFVGCTLNGAIFNGHSLRTLNDIANCNPPNPHINFFDDTIGACYNFRIQDFYRAMKANNDSRFFSSGKFSQWDNLPNEQPEQKFLRVAKYALNTPGGKMIEIFQEVLRQQTPGRIVFRPRTGL